MTTVVTVSEEDTLRLGIKLAKHLHPGDVVFFYGALGAGKTTLIRGLLRGWHYTGFVKSPTYALIELYPVDQWQIVHVDLYRLRDAHALIDLGLSDYLTANSILLIEWPENFERYLPNPTLRCQIQYRNQHRQLDFSSENPQTQQWLQQL